MSQNLVSLHFSEADLATIDGALDTLEERFAQLIELSVAQRSSINKMGDKSEAFCRLTLNVLRQNPEIIPATIDIAEAARDLDNLDLMRQRFSRLRRLMNRADDTDMALRSDIYDAAREGYAVAKVAAKGAAFDAIRESAAGRYGKNGKRSADNTSGAA